METQSKTALAFQSRTVWTVIATIIINAVPAVRDLIPADLLPIVDAVLGLLAIYFRVNVKAGIQQ